MSQKTYRNRPKSFCSGAGAKLQSGFSLVEIMVGLVIGLVATVVMMQIFQSWEERKRTTESGANASIAGVTAFYDLQRVIRQAGYGFNNLSLFNCLLTLPNGAKVPLAPLTVIPAADAGTLVPAGDPNTDRLLIISGNGNSQPQGDFIQNIDGATSSYVVQMAIGFAKGDYVFAAADPCTAATLTKVADLPGETKVKTDAAPVSANMLVNLGAKPNIQAYAIRNGALTVCDYSANDCSASVTAPAWQIVSDNIVSLKAQYARDTTAVPDGVIDVFDQTALSTATGIAGACSVARATGVRVALVARSAQYETDVDPTTKERSCQVVTGNALSWDGSATAPINLTKMPDGTSSADWQCYRYRVFQSVIPLRNLDWLATTGC